MSAFGLSLAEIDSFYFDDAIAFVEEAEELDRQHYKALLAVASYPYLKEADRRSVWASFSKTTRAKRPRPTVKYSKPQGGPDGV